ncbi:hypothetical protein BDQ17DRAFT_1336816 [Cyathus striatus]|nr:hypothetical protein BDQ17DRAFT_1336816 [Cyathus striatus]
MWQYYVPLPGSEGTPCWNGTNPDDADEVANFDEAKESSWQSFKWRLCDQYLRDDDESWYMKRAERLVKLYKGTVGLNDSAIWREFKESICQGVFDKVTGNLVLLSEATCVNLVVDVLDTEFRAVLQRYLNEYSGLTEVLAHCDEILNRKLKSSDFDVSSSREDSVGIQNGLVSDMSEFRDIMNNITSCSFAGTVESLDITINDAEVPRDVFPMRDFVYDTWRRASAQLAQNRSDYLCEMIEVRNVIIGQSAMTVEYLQDEIQYQELPYKPRTTGFASQETSDSVNRVLDDVYESRSITTSTDIDQADKFVENDQYKSLSLVHRVHSMNVDRELNKVTSSKYSVPSIYFDREFTVEHTQLVYEVLDDNPSISDCTESRDSLEIETATLESVQNPYEPYSQYLSDNESNLHINLRESEGCCKFPERNELQCQRVELEPETDSHMEKSDDAIPIEKSNWEFHLLSIERSAFDTETDTLKGCEIVSRIESAKSVERTVGNLSLATYNMPDMRNLIESETEIEMVNPSSETDNLLSLFEMTESNSYKLEMDSVQMAEQSDTETLVEYSSSPSTDEVPDNAVQSNRSKYTRFWTYLRDIVDETILHIADSFECSEKIVAEVGDIQLGLEIELSVAEMIDGNELVTEPTLETDRDVAMVPGARLSPALPAEISN